MRRLMYVFKLILNIIFIFCNNNILGSEDHLKTTSACGESGYIFVATIDGNLSALDFDSGNKCWTTFLDAEGFISSSLSKLEVWENGTQVWLIPSLDGVLFKYDKVKLEPLPFNTESLLSQSSILDSSTLITGGKFKLVYGINRHTGEISYKCSMDGCVTFSVSLMSKNVLIIEHMVQKVNAMDSISAEHRWHFRVVEVRIKTVVDSTSNGNYSYAPNTSEENGLIPMNIYNDLDILKVVKISLLNGYTAKLNHSSFHFTWIYKTLIPIVDVWYVKDRRVQLLDPFADEAEFFRVDSGDGKHTAMLFLGTYMDQLFVKQSKKLKTKVIYNHAITKQAQYEAYCLQINPKAKPPGLLLPNESNALVAEHMSINDHGFYFYINFSVYDNETHCIVDFNYPKQFNRLTQVNNWLRVISAALIVILPIMGGIILRRFRVKKQFANESTSTLEITSPVPEIFKHIEKTHFNSRFHKDFHMIAILGRGGFGVVMEVKNKFDDCKYAVKRIRIRVGKRYKKMGYGFVMREVKALAKLDHPGVVRYFNSWIENPPGGWQELKDQELQITDVSHSTNQDEHLLSVSDDRLQEEMHMKLPEKLGVNPLQPFTDNFLNAPSKILKNGEIELDTISSASDSSVLNHDSETLSENNTSKNSISFSEEEDSLQTKDFSFNENLFYSKRHNLIKNYNYSKPRNIGLVSKHSFTSSKDSDFQIIFKSPRDQFIDKDTVFLHLKEININLIFRMKMKYLKKLRHYIFYDVACPDPDESDWTGWTIVLHDINPSKIPVNLVWLQNWLISVLCTLQYSESYYHDLLHSNLCNILWELNLLLETEICDINYTYSKTFSESMISDFFILKYANSYLAWPLKFIYLVKLRHYLFCDSRLCVKPNWNSLFYRADINIYKENLYIFRVWIISILCAIRPENNCFSLVTFNLCKMLSEVNTLLLNDYFVPNSPEEFFIIYGKLLTQPRYVHSEDNSSLLHLIMFHNYHLSKKPQIQDIEDEDKSGFLYIQMQLCRRESLRNWLDSHSLIRNYSEVMNIFCQIVDAMDYVHTQGLMHRDLKPSNIYFSLEGFIKIGDFGLATQFEVQGLGDDSTIANILYNHTRYCGTDLYMSPEQRSKKYYNFKTDIFAIGIILYELLVPFKTTTERYKSILDVREEKFSPDFTSRYPEECMLVRHLLDLEPENRPTASEIKNHPLCQPFLQFSRT